MTFNEFKAWLEGYEASFAFQRSPNAEQWQIIREKLATVIITTSPTYTHTLPIPDTGKPFGGWPFTTCYNQSSTEDRYKKVVDT